MTDKAALLATFSDFRLVKGRKCAQLVFEVAIENADAALKALGGVPMPMSEVWCGIARIETNTAKMPSAGPFVPKERRKWDELSYAEQAGIRCADPAFRKWIDVDSVLDAAQWIRQQCWVKSRVELKPGTGPGSRWQQLDQDYQSWLHNVEHVA